MQRPLPWKPNAIATTAMSIVLALLLLPACCCRQRAGAPVTEPPPKSVSPLIGTQQIPTPSEAKSAVQAEMHNVWFHIDEQAYLDIHQLRGEMVPFEKGAPVNFDNKLTFIMAVDTGKIGMRSASLDILMNRYVFNAPGSPLRNLHITTDGKQLKQEGIVHKIIDISFVMWADVSASGGKIRLHPTKMEMCGLNGLGLLRAVGMTLEKMIGKELPHDKGVTAEGNDMLMDPNKMLPPPKVELHLSMCGWRAMS